MNTKQKINLNNIRKVGKTVDSALLVKYWVYLDKVPLFLICSSSMLTHFKSMIPFIPPEKKENLWFSNVFRGYKYGSFACNRTIEC